MALEGSHRISREQLLSNHGLHFTGSVTSFHHCLINCYNLSIFIVFPCSSLLSLTPSWPRFIALFAPTLFPLQAQSVDSQSISTLFLIRADAIKIIAVYEKQSCWRKCEIELLDNLNDLPFL